MQTTQPVKQDLAIKETDVYVLEDIEGIDVNLVSKLSSRCLHACSSTKATCMYI